MDKVMNGTPIHGNSICYSCQHGMRVQGFGMKEALHCTYNGRLIHFAVRQCSLYHNRNTPEIAEMKKIAWVIESRNRGPWGFKGEQDTEIVVRPPNIQPEVPATQEGEW
jgi:hypothetical protein